MIRLSDIVSHAGLAIYAQVALVLFFAVFIAVTIRTLLPSRREELDEAARLPLEHDDAPTSNVHGGQ